MFIRIIDVILPLPPSCLKKNNKLEDNTFHRKCENLAGD